MDKETTEGLDTFFTINGRGSISIYWKYKIKQKILANFAYNAIIAQSTFKEIQIYQTRPILAQITHGNYAYLLYIAEDI